MEVGGCLRERRKEVALGRLRTLTTLLILGAWGAATDGAPPDDAAAPPTRGTPAVAGATRQIPGGRGRALQQRSISAGGQVSQAAAAVSRSALRRASRRCSTPTWKRWPKPRTAAVAAARGKRTRAERPRRREAAPAPWSPSSRRSVPEAAAPVVVTELRRPGGEASPAESPGRSGTPGPDPGPGESDSDHGRLGRGSAAGHRPGGGPRPPTTSRRAAVAAPGGPRADPPG